MKKNLLLILLLSFSVFSKIYASHVMGADLTFSCIGPNQYLVTLTGYRDCNGIDLTGPLTINYSSAQCGVSSTLTLNQVGSAVDITPVCFSTTDACNGGSGFGVQKDIFQGTLTLPAGCGSDWILSWSLCCRNSAITTLSNPGNDNLYIEAHLNNTLPSCDNSPTFSNDPIAIYCSGFLQQYNQGAIDANGDSLHYYLMPSLDAANTPEAYNGGYSATNPMSTASGTTIDPLTGQLTFTPNQTQVAVVKVGVDEYRNGVLIGHVERDMQIIVTNCTNSAPTAGGINGATGTNANTFNTTACSNFCFTIQTADANAADSVYYTWVGSNLPGATITSSGGLKPLLTVCWAPTQGDVGTHNFVINLRNNDCPYYGTASIAYTVIVAPASDPPVNAGADVHLCQGQSTTLTATSAGTVTGYTWSDGTTTHSGATWTVSPAITTLYTVTAVYANGCQLTDQVIVYRNPKPTVTAYPPVSTICSTSDTVQITAIATNAATYSWFPAAGLTCTNCPDPKASPTVSTTYSVVALDSAGCGSDTFHVTVNLNSPPPQQSCSVIYATTTGTGTGGQYDPTNLPNALALAQCNNAIIKLAIGTYTVDYPISNIGSYTTIEGGFDPANNWIKSSLPGATTIFRSNLNMEGSGQTKRLVGIYLNGAQYIRFQDLTLQTANCPATLGTDTFGSTNYVVHMTNCSNYNFVRCQVKPGSGSDGAIGANTAGAGTAGANGITATGNGAAGAPPGAGPNAGGNGGNGGNGGTASGGSGTTGGTGTGAGAGTGGAGGSGGITCPSFIIFNGGAGSPGGNGSAGTNGTFGAVGTPGAIAGGFFTAGGAGGNGTSGSPGSGGGGGGGCGGAALNTNGGGGGSGGSGGGGGPGGGGGYGGGGCFGIFINNNGANGVILECNIGPLAAGAGGPGGLGGAGGTGGTGGAGNTTGSGCNNPFGAGGNGGIGGAGGNGGNGAAGSASRVYINGGSALVTGDTVFGLVAQPTIFASNISCTHRNDTLSSAASGSWTTGVGATVPSGSGTQIITQYTNTGRKDIGYNANVYSGFVNIALDQSSFIPVIQSTASVLNGDTFYVCQGSTANFNIQIASADTFSWNFGGATIPNVYYGANQQNLSGLTFNTAGTYMVVANIKTSCCGWSPYDTAYILVEPQPTISYVGTTSFCPGDSAHITLSGTGSGYQWTPTSGISNPTGSDVYAHPLSSTTYVVTSLSPRGLCNADTSIPVTVLVPPTLAFTIVPASCGSNGGATVTPTPAGNYTYSWNPTGSTISSISNQPSGNYTVTVTPVGSSCSVSAVATIGTNGGVQAFIIKSISPLCNGACNGEIKVKAIGGTGPYTYLWSPGGSTIDSLNNLCPLLYSVTVTDANGCSATTSQTLSQPLPLNVAVIDSSNSHCAGQCTGSALIDGQGGTGPYTFTWTPAESPANNPTNLCPGTYAITVTDHNNCTGTRSLTISTAATPATVTFNTVPESCPGKCNAYSTPIITNGAPPFIYHWSNGPTTATDSNLCVGIYSLMITDSFTCVQTVQDTVTPSTAPQMAVTFASVPETCPGKCNASSVATVINGTGPYTYLWSNGNTTATDINLCDTIYALTVTDASTCSVVVPDTISPSTATAMSVTFAAVPETCPGTCDGSITATVTNGATPYTYNWNNGAATPSDNSLCAATYHLTVTDANGCSVAVSDSLSPSLNTVAGFSLTANSLNICSDRADSVVLTASVDSLTQSQVNFIWSTGQTVNAVYSSQVTVDSAGTYQVIAEKGGCRTTLSEAITALKCDSTCKIAIADAFTPNGDGKNDVYKVLHQCPMNSFTLRIYNRWGEQVYESNDIDKGWDGTYKGAPAASEAYVFYVCTKEKATSDEICKTGKLTLIR